jgi:hypothetical protein
LRPGLRWLVLYFVMTAIPVGIGVSALHFGRDLTAPVSLRGQWTVRTESTIAAARRCLPARARGEETYGVEISQAGREVAVVGLTRPSPTTFRGHVHDGTLVARTESMIVRARVDRQDDRGATRMVGTIRFPRCPLVEVPFQAHREQRLT